MAGTVTSEVVILTGLSANPGRLAGLVRRYGWITRFIPFTKTAIDPAPYIQPIFLVEIDGTTTEVRNRIADLSEMESLRNCPMAVIGMGAHSFRDLLRHFFPTSATISTPFSEHELVTTLRELTYGRSRREETETPLPAEVQLHPSLPKSFDAFSGPLTLRSLATMTVGGLEFSRAYQPSDLLGKNYLPENPILREIMNRRLRAASPWGVGQFHRTSYTAAAVLSHLPLANSHREDGREAALVYGLASLTAPQVVQRLDLLAPSSQKARESLAAILRNEGTPIFEAAGISAGRRILEAATLLLTDPLAAVAGPEHTIASAVVGSDLLARACWNSGAYRQSGAHRVLTRLKDGTFPARDPSVAVVLLKLVLETAEGHIPRKLVPKGATERTALASLAQSQLTAPLERNEIRVNLSQLKPGMRLTKPIIAYDGRTLADPNLVLDLDLVWRIWTLAATFPLNTPFIAVEQAGAA